MEDVVDIYKELAAKSDIKCASISDAETPGHVIIRSEWTQRDLDRLEKVKFSRQHTVQLDTVFSSLPVESTSESLSKESHSGLMKAVLRSVVDKKGEEKQYIEIWGEKRKHVSVDVSSIERHGKVYDDDEFGCFRWSHSDTHLLYVAEKKKPKFKSYFEKRTATEKESDVKRGEKYVYEGNWGEQLTSRSHPVICVLDIESGVVSTLENLPDDVSPGQAVWCPGDTGIVCVGWYNEAYRLGLIYCPTRRSALFHVDLKNYQCTLLTTSDKSVRCPVFSPDGQKLIYLENAAGGPHCQCSRLMMIDWATKGNLCVVDIVRSAPVGNFAGIYGSLASRCWLSDNKHILLSTNIRSRINLVQINCETGTVTVVPTDDQYGSVQLLDVHDDVILVSLSSLSCPPLLALGQLSDDKGVQWLKLDADVPVPGITWSIHPFTVPADQVNAKFPHLDYEYTLMLPTGKDTSVKPPLAVFNHGGPHSIFPAAWALYFAALCRCGYAVLLVHYRGSIGFGADSIDSLLGNVGTQDVRDVQTVVKYVLERNVVDQSRVVVLGGSHGGFLTAHLVGQYPNFYKAAVCRNPAINLASMVTSTDIPDWCYVEAGSTFDFRNVPDGAVYASFYDKSPIRYVDQIRTPVMVMIGADDKRVPPQQGKELFNALQARGVPSRLHWYPENSHPLNKVDAESDCFVNIVKWFEDHLKTSPQPLA